ncbi:uncharacterized protein I303_107847 [Kwoniella dejecticola CBS 10117]|uniref:Uncharacterized protein n=1 Tax=Kwoniella dejecticola CBS 10117 TaxID=1296121 RepID=A0A1A5ZVV9_9TREE|nr:uncharacterized protein I303_07851 [Kwoniella dejecticola CBS 10117]OBR81939.1 hypothetical protein I303_07851 [Kwoniella dejecticola CBS 10117]
MSTRRQDENTIVATSRRGIAHTLASANKIRSSKENVLSSTKAVGKSSTSAVLGERDDTKSRLKKKEIEGKGDEKNLRTFTKPSEKGKIPSNATTTTARRALSTKSTSAQLQTTVSSRGIAATKTPGTRLKAKLISTPTQTPRTKRTLNIYTPGPSIKAKDSTNDIKPNTKSKLQPRIAEDSEDIDEVDDVEYMPPPIKELEYTSHFAMPIHGNDKDTDLDLLRADGDTNANMSEEPAPFSLDNMGFDSLDEEVHPNFDLDLDLDVDVDLKLNDQDDLVLDI